MNKMGYPPLSALYCRPSIPVAVDVSRENLRAILIVRLINDLM